jgi:hypothetical protein
MTRTHRHSQGNISISDVHTLQSALGVQWTVIRGLKNRSKIKETSSVSLVFGKPVSKV